MKRLILIDSHAIIHRAYHALPPLTSPSGAPTQAVYGFTTIVLRILRDLQADYIAAAFDLAGPTFRHIVSERYKATRPETPSDLASQFASVKEILNAFNIPVFEQEGYEADDIIGTIVKKVAHVQDLETIIVTGDMDFVQLVGPRVKLYAMKKGVSDIMIYDKFAVKERYGFEPKQMVDFKALKGDTSDNIAGVKGIGEKTALTLIQTFGSVEEIYKQLKKETKKISGLVAEKLREGEEDARLSKELATIHNSVPLDLRLDALRRKNKDVQKIRSVFQKFGFFGLLKRFDEDQSSDHVGVTAQSLTFTRSEKNLNNEEGIVTISNIKEFNMFISIAGNNRFGCMIDNETLYIVREKKMTTARIVPVLLKEKEIKQFFETHHFICHDAKCVIRFLERFGIELGVVDMDVMIMSYLTGSFSRDFSYAALIGRELGRPASLHIIEELIHIFEIAALLEKKLESEHTQDIFFKIELPIIRILADMEAKGVVVDALFLKNLAKKINTDLTRTTATIYKQAGQEFNINSPRQLSHILFNVLKLETSGLKKTIKGGVISTGAMELEKLKSSHPIIVHILSYRELMKLKTTYVDVLPVLIDSFDGRIHTTFNQTIASTGRLSSSNPNLQNIPIMSVYGREIRKSFIAQSGFLFCSFDYSQIELRVAAHLSGDEKMIKAFQDGLDIHTMTASAIYHIPLEHVTRELRRAAKTLNFGILYGMGAIALAQSTDMSVEQAKKFIDDYFHEFAGVRHYLDRTKEFVQTHGYVQTLFGRRRYIPEIHSPNWQIKREAERMAINMPIQGTATGDIVKMAMINVDTWVKKHHHAEHVRMILQVHDELVFEIREEYAGAYIPEIKKIMEHVAHLSVPLIVDVKVGNNWGDQKTFG